MRPYYRRGDLTIYQGDCREILPALAHLPLLGILTDPPYGVRERTDRASRSNGTTPGGQVMRATSRLNWAPIAGDDQPFDPRHLLGRGRLILWGANHYAETLPPSPAWIVWDKRDQVGSNDNSDCELAWTNLGGPARIYRQLWMGMLKQGEEAGRPRLHPAQKPVALLAYCLRRLSAGGARGLVLDPYLGAGTTLAAALDLGFPAIGIEIDPRWCQTAAERLDARADARAALATGAP